jgi:hypothetical protein
MKRALLILALFVAPVALFAQSGDRAMLLTPGGTLYSIESNVNAEATSSITSMRYLTLTIQNGQNIIKTNVPASTKGGNNWQPELAYDSDSDALLVFWLRSQNSVLGTSELLFCTFQNGKWNAAASVDDVPYHFRYNLKVGVTRTYQVYDPETGDSKQVPGLSVHVAWWDESAIGEMGRYAMLTVEKGVVTDIYRHDLTDFIMSGALLKYFELDEASREILRHPIIFESAAHDTVDVVFGDMTTNALHRLTLKPVLNTRVRIPIGIRDTAYPAPKYQIGSDATLSAISTPPDQLVFYYKTNGAVKYLMFEDGAWAREKSIAITSEVSAEAAVAALRRLIRGD